MLLRRVWQYASVPSLRPTRYRQLSSVTLPSHVPRRGRFKSHIDNLRRQFSVAIVPRAALSVQPAPSANAAFRDRTASVSKALKALDSYAEWKAMHAEVTMLEKKLEDEQVWNNSAAAMKVNARLGRLRKQLSTYQDLTSSYKHLSELACVPEFDLGPQMGRELISEFENLQARINKYLISLWLSRPTDSNSAYIDIRAGSGGTEACDWASMLGRMYTRWAQSQNFNVQVVDESPGDVAGIKATTLLIEGQFAYGYAQYESGVHRLVRISPFDNAGARHTSFASVRVSPHFDDNAEDIGVEVKPSDLKITTMRSQGAGGQHVNKTESAVRIVHIPSGITVLCQQERSQHRNKLLALSLLKSKLCDIERKKKAQSKADVHNTLAENSWGSQVRSYVLQPYQLVKDTRTGFEVSGGAQKVLDGDLDDFMEANLRKFRAKS